MLFNTEKFVNKSMSLACFIENYDVEPAQFRISAVLMKDGQILKHLKDDNQKLAGYTDGKAGHAYYIMRDIPLEVAGVADGEYQVCFAICPVGQDKWTVLRHPVGNSAYGVVKVEKGVIVADMEYSLHLTLNCCRKSTLTVLFMLKELVLYGSNCRTRARISTSVSSSLSSLQRLIRRRFTPVIRFRQASMVTVPRTMKRYLLCLNSSLQDVMQ